MSTDEPHKEACTHYNKLQAKNDEGLIIKPKCFHLPLNSMHSRKKPRKLQGAKIAVVTDPLSSDKGMFMSCITKTKGEIEK